MPFAIENPIALVLLLALPGLYLLGRGRLSLMAPWRARAILAARLVSMAAIILALAGPSMPLNDATMSVAFVLDNSASITPETRSRQEEWIRQAISRMRSSDRAAVVTFAGNARVTRAPGSEKDLHLPGNAGLEAGTDLSAALRLASGLLPASGLRKVVLLSDGWDTAGKAEEAARSLPAGIRVDAAPWASMEGQPEALIESVEVPSYVREGDSFDVSAVVGSNHEGSAELRVLVDGQQTGAWGVELGAGANLVTISQKAVPLGFHSAEVQLAVSGDTVRENNRAVGFVVVKPKARVLLVEGRPGTGDYLRQQLEGSGLQVDRILASGFPIQMSLLLQYESVVLNDVSGTSLSLDQMKSLDAYVKDQGRGLLVVGGTASYGLGDYTSGALEQILPVSSDVPLSRDRGDMALILVVDKSGSMDDTFEGVTKIAMAREAAIQATEVLKPQDQLGVIAFDTEPKWIVPVQKVGGNLPAIRSRISSLQASGGTDIYTSLQTAYNTMRTVQATNKHVTLLTDGQSWKGPYELLLQRMKSARITLSTIAIGSDADKDWLAVLARLGDGRSYYSARFSDVPKIVYREVTAATRVAEVEGKVDPVFVAPSPVLRGMSQEGMPSLGGYVATKPKDAATIVLRSVRGDPLLAQWQYGLGRVVAWTSDAQGPWSSAWAADPQFSRVWDQAVRWSMPPPIDNNLRVSVVVDGRRATITAQSVDHNGQFVNLAETTAQLQFPNGNRMAVALRQTAPGRYQGIAPAAAPGLYRVDVQQVRTGQPGVLETSGYAVPFAPEFRRLGSNDALLKELASATGGRSIRDSSDAFSRQGMPSSPGWEPLWPYLLSAALLLLVIEVALRRIRTLPFRRRSEDEFQTEEPEQARIGSAV